MDQGLHKQSVNIQTRLKNSHLHHFCQTGFETTAAPQLLSDVTQNNTMLYIKKAVPFSGYEEVMRAIAGVLQRRHILVVRNEFLL